MTVERQVAARIESRSQHQILQRWRVNPSRDLSLDSHGAVPSTLMIFSRTKKRLYGCTILFSAWSPNRTVLGGDDENSGFGHPVRRRFGPSGAPKAAHTKDSMGDPG